MTKDQLSAALKMAEDTNEHFLDSEGKPLVDISMFWGFTNYAFRPITCTLRQLAALLRWQCVRINGEIDAEYLNEIATAGKHKFNVV